MKQDGLPCLPDVVRNNVECYFGQEGRAWCESFLEILSEVLHEWGLTFLSVYPQLSINFVCKVRCADGTEAVLKLGCPHKDFETECLALQHFSGGSAVKLLRSDISQGWMLLECIHPGESIRVLDDDHAMSVAAACMKKLWKSPPDKNLFPDVLDWYQAFEHYREGPRDQQPLHHEVVIHADRLFSDLIKTMSPSVVLHGDLHHDNILSAGENRWVVIDPKGICGEPEYEVGALLRNPMPEVFSDSQAVETLKRRISLLSDILGFDPFRLAAWTYAQGILSVLWSLDGSSDTWRPCYEWACSIKETYKL